MDAIQAIDLGCPMKCIEPRYFYHYAGLCGRIQQLLLDCGITSSMRTRIGDKILDLWDWSIIGGRSCRYTRVGFIDVLVDIRTKYQSIFDALCQLPLPIGMEIYNEFVGRKVYNAL